MIELDKIEFDKKQKAVVLFGACAWCANCREAKRKLESLEDKYPEFTFCEIDVDKHIDIGDEYKIYELPTLIAFKGNKEISRWTDEIGDLLGWINMLTW